VAGSHEVYEVLKSVDGLKVTIREAGNHDHKIELISSVLQTLIRALQDMI
jgi:hypothetical protein